MDDQRYWNYRELGSKFWQNVIVPLLKEELDEYCEQEAGAFYDGLFYEAERLN